MKLSTKSRYAVMALADIARFKNNEPISLRDISIRQGISLVYLEQLFLKLKKNEIVKSIRGKKGGYTLNKTPNDAPVKIKRIQATGRENFLWNSTKYLLLDFE